MEIERILIVDDEPSVLSAIKRLLEFSGHQVMCSERAEDALQLMREKDFAVVVSDNRMPGMTGIEFLSLAKTVSPNTERILMTGAADLETAMDAINRGEVFRFVTKPWDNEQLLYIVTEALWRRQLVQSLRHGDEAVFLSIARMVELKDAYTQGHSERVATVAQMICSVLELDEEFRNSVKWGSWLHDCGKVGVPEAILNSPNEPSAREWQMLKKHPEWGASVTRQAGMSQRIINIVLYHHENYDGSGYPHGLQGENIPLEARIVAVADVFDALTSDRSYRTRHSGKECFEIMEAMKGTKLDPHLVDILVHLSRDECLSASPCCTWPGDDDLRRLVKYDERGKIGEQHEVVGVTRNGL